MMVNEYYNKNKERCKKKMREYYRKNQEKLSQDNKKYYLENKKKIGERDKKKYQKNRVEKVLKQRKYYYENRTDILSKVSNFAKKNRDLMNLKRIKYETANPEKVRARNIAKYRIPIPKGQMCVICNKRKATDREHRNHANPLDVQFTCHKCNCKFERLVL